jgi:N-acetylglucosaminyldiphosphoundecaprenol N-acetyl-beta-D-mannosaminyltransferase
MKKHEDTREVLCLAGIPLDVVTLADTVACVHEAVLSCSRLFITTPNLHFLSLGKTDFDFRQTLRDSDLCVADGMPLVWISRLLGARLPERVAGSDLFEKLSHEPAPSGQQTIRVFFYGGQPGSAAAASEQLNEHSQGMRCVGFRTPGFGSAEDLSTDETLEQINQSKADFLVVALEARKAQQWIQLNLTRLKIPVICNLGAVINFQSQRIKRAPTWVRRGGMEWLWRIKEEPELWRRYWLDLQVLVVLLLSKILPYAIWLGMRRMYRKVMRGFSYRFKHQLMCRLKHRLAGACQCKRSDSDTREAATSTLVVREDGLQATLSLFGAVDDAVPMQINLHLSQALTLQLPVSIDLQHFVFFGPLFGGRLLRFMAAMRSSGQSLQLTSVSKTLRLLFFWNGIL